MQVPVLGQNCAAGNCHGSMANTLHLTCGNDATSRSAGTTSPRATTCPRTRPRARSCGARCPRGGRHVPRRRHRFSDARRPGYETLEAWATEKGGPTNVPTDAGFQFFADRVQPMLVKRGCMMLGCHSRLDVPRLSPARRKRRPLRPARDAHELRAVARAARARIDRACTRAGSSARISLPKRAASATAAVRCSA